MVEYQLCETWSCVIQSMRDFQQLAVGVLAIVAAMIAFVAAITATRRGERHRRRAAAAAFWAELMQCKKQLERDRDVILDGSLKDPRRSPIRPPRTEIFDGDPAAIGLLSAQEAFLVARSYEWLHEIRARYEDVKGFDHLDEKYVNLASGINIVVDGISDTLRKIRGTAGVTKRQAREMERHNLDSTSWRRGRE
jgi:hypothetical protein